MKRSLQVAAPLLASTALAILTGCHDKPMQRCVDEHNQVVDESFCKNLPQDQPRTDNQNYFYPRYHYYYGGSGGFFPGSYASGGSLTPSPGVSYSSGSSTSRGGFGGSMSSGGEGGGHGGGGGGE